jgi:hypothetical protein
LSRKRRKSYTLVAILESNGTLVAEDFCVFFIRSMDVETLGDAFTHSSRATARCAGGVVDDRTHTRPCVYREELDLHTLVWTRGRNFPLARLESRLMCPRCGGRRVVLVFQTPAEPQRAKAEKRA